MIESPTVLAKIDATRQAMLDAFTGHVRAIYVMGSITREATDTSDLDVAVVFEDPYYDEHIDEILPRFTAVASRVNMAHPAHPLALWASKVDHYATFFPDVSYVRRNVPRDADRLDAWSGLAKHTLLHYEVKSAMLVHGDFDLGAAMTAKVPRSEAVELFLISTRTLAEGLDEMSQPGEDARKAGISHVAKAGLRAVYAAAIREHGKPLDSYAEILAWSATNCPPPYDTIAADLHAIKAGRDPRAFDSAQRRDDSPVPSVLRLMRHCEQRIADAPRQKIGGLTMARAGESFAFSPDELFREADPIDQYSRFAGLPDNHVHALYFLLTARAIVQRLIRADVKDGDVLDFFFEELSILASYAFFNPDGLRMVLGRRERDVFTIVVDRAFLQDLSRLLGRLAAAYDSGVVAADDAPWLTRETKRSRLRALLAQYATVPGLELGPRTEPDVRDVVDASAWQARILTGVFNPKLVQLLNRLGLTLYQAGEARAAQAVLSQPLAAARVAKEASAEVGLTEEGVRALDRELSKTHQYYAVTCQRLGDTPRARTEYLEALKLDPDNYSALDDLASLLLATDPSETSVALLSQMIDAAGPARAESRRQISGRYLTRAIDLKQAGNFAEAEVWYRRAVQADRAFEKPPYNLGILLEQSHRLDEAAESYRAAISANPAYAQPYVRLGLLLERVGDVAGAERLLESGVAAGASSEHLFANLANCKLQLEKYPDAFANYRKALEVNGEHADAWNGMGAAIMAAGDPDDRSTFEKAALCFQRAFEIDPSFTDAGANYQRAVHRLSQFS